MKPFLYERLTQALLAEMASGMYSEGKRFLSERKICRLWNVSEPTAQHALRVLVEAGLIATVPRSGLILCPDFQKRALLLLHKSRGPTLPPPSTWETKRSRLLHPGKSERRCLGIILDQGSQSGAADAPDPADLAALQAARVFFQEALKTGCEVEYFYQNGSGTREDLIVNELQRKQVNAVACFRRFHTQELRPLIERILRLRLPVLTLFDDCEHVAASSINFNNIGAGYDAIRVLLDRGHRRILVLMPRYFIANIEQRYEGCRLAAAECAATGEASLIVCRLPDSGSARAVLRKIFLGSPNPPTALFSPGISTFLRIEPILKSFGLKVPRGISVIGCGNRDLLPLTHRRLDLIKCDFEAAGRLAFHHLLGLLEGTPTTRAFLIPTPYEPAGSVRSLSTKCRGKQA